MTMKILNAFISFITNKHTAGSALNVPQIDAKKEITVPTIKPVEKNVYSDYCICIDPGHSAETRGKKSPYSLNKIEPELPFEEWKFNREVTDYLKQMLEKKGFNVYITTDEERDGKEDVKLAERAIRANEYVQNNKKTGLFISIHANADGKGDKWTSANGWSAYTTPKQNNSDILAEYLYKAAENMFLPFGLKIRRDTTDGDSDFEKNFLIIVKANMPAVLTENFFYTNIKDTEFISSENGKKMIAEMHFNGIVNFINDRYIKKSKK